MQFALEDKYRLIKEEVAKSASADPIEIARGVMRKDFVSIHGPEHHFLDGAAFLTAYNNAGGGIDLDRCLDELAKRTIKMPGAMCGYWGICGSLASVGAALSVIHGTGPLSTDEFYKHNMEYTSRVLTDMSKIGGARCCKRNAFLSLSHAVKFVNEKYGIEMKSGNIECEFSASNDQCLHDKCPFYEKSSENK